MKKRYALMVCMTVCGAALFAQTAADFTTTPDGGGVVIAKYTGAGGDVVIPATIGGKAVVGIGMFAFTGNKSLRTVTIPAGVTSIGEWAFQGCSSLSAISVAPANKQYKDMDGVLFTKDGTALILYPRGGKPVYTIPAGVTAIGDSAFSGCTGLKTVMIPARVTSIGEGAFGVCSSLGAISVSPENQQYKDIDGVLFTKDGKKLLRYPAGGEKTAYAIPDSVTVIGNVAFYECSSLTSVTIPAGVASIGESAFYGCTGLTSVAIPAGVASIGESAFYGCSGLKSVVRADIEKRFGRSVF